MSRRQDLRRDYFRALEAERLAEVEVEELGRALLDAKGPALAALQKRMERARADLEDCFIDVSGAAYDLKHAPYEKTVSTLTHEQRQAILERALDSWLTR